MVAKDQSLASMEVLEYSKVRKFFKVYRYTIKSRYISEIIFIFLREFTKQFRCRPSKIIRSLNFTKISYIIYLKIKITCHFLHA